MPSQREIRRRITSVRNIKQITRAMQFVGRPRSSSERKTRLFSRVRMRTRSTRFSADLASVLGADDHPLLAKREEGKRLIVLLTSDRGLAGSLSTNVIRKASEEITASTTDLAVVTVGRKGHAPCAAPRAHRRDFDGYGDRPASRGHPAGALLTDDYLAGTYSRIDLVYPRFVSTLRPAARRRRLLPVEPSEDTDGIPATSSSSSPTRTRSCASSCRATSRRASTRRAWS
jgi:F-type H+-transporting ATPase subunit gamma